MAELFQQKEGLLGKDAPAPASLKASPSDDGASASASVMKSLLGEDASAVERLPGDGASVVKKGKVLVFDTETTGLPLTSYNENIAFQSSMLLSKDDWVKSDMGSILVEKGKPGEKNKYKKTASLPLIERWPYIIQFSCVLYDLDTHEYSMYNKYVIDLQTDAVALLSNPDTHETIKGALIKRKEAMEEENQPLMATRVQIITDFLGMLTSNPDITLVGHNVAFDYRMMLAEAFRLSLDPETKIKYEGYTETLEGFTRFCTCQNTLPAKILGVDRNPKAFVKLMDLHEKLFGYVPKDLHDSLTDSIVTLRCYYRLINPNPESDVAFCGPGTPDIYLIAGETKTPELETIQSHIERITPDRSALESKIALESKALAHECTDTVLGGNRKRTRRKKQKSRRKKYTSRRRR
jgi:DNA polymerase-3 subunit epsilon